MSHVLPEDRWLPGLGWPSERHLVAAGTEELPGHEQHYRAMCGAVCLRMPTGTGPYAYEVWPVHDVCAGALRMLCRA